MFLAPALVLMGQVVAPLSGTAVDPEGRPLSGIEVMLVRGQALDGTVPILERATTDARGRYTIAPPSLRGRSAGRVAIAVCAYHPGSGLVSVLSLLKPGNAEGFRLAFQAAGRRTITVRDGDGRPLAGVRVAPIAVSAVQAEYTFIGLHEALADRMEATTGADGRAELASLEPTTKLGYLRAIVPGLGVHAIALPENQMKSEAVTLDLKRAGRIRSRIRHADGTPAAGVHVDIWSRGGAIVPLMPVRFEAGPVRSGEDGTYETPTALLAGVKYRALIRADGFRPVLTEWVTPGPGADGVTTLPPVLLKPLRDVEGRVADRQGRPVAGAEVVSAGESASATTDAMGQFRLAGLASSRPILVVRAEGFRIDGRLLGDRGGAVEVVLSRFDEPAARPLTTLESPIPAEERRRLARRVLEPYLVKVLARGTDTDKTWALRSLMTFDPGAVLEALDHTEFERKAYEQSFVRYELARSLARDDPDEAAAVATSIPEAYRRAQALVEICAAVPERDRARRRALVDQVLLAARAEPEPGAKLWQLGEAAELLLDLGETDRARAVFAEGQAIAKKLGGGPAGEFVAYFASRLARVDLPSALALLGGSDQARNQAVAFGNVAARIAAINPAEAERLIEAVKGGLRSSGVTLRTCQNMARADLGRARRIALGQQSPRFRAAALVFAASGLPDAERQSARELIQEAVRVLDQGRNLFDTYWLTPAALTPLAEAIDLGLVPELFWRAVADIAVADDPREEHGRNDVLGVALLLARYDRDVASALFEPAEKASAARGTEAGGMLPMELALLAAIAPHRAVAAVEAMPEPPGVELREANWLRIRLSDQLGADVEAQWRRIWAVFSGLGGVLDRRDVVL